jgi:hypothetical protein
MLTDDAPVVPLTNGKPAVLVSARIGNYQDSPYDGPVLSHMWVQ